MDSARSHSLRHEHRSDAELARETIFEILSNDRRRYVLEYLAHSGDGTADFDALVDHVASHETELPPEDVDYRTRKRAYVSLRQSHLPKLHKTGVVDYDPVRGTAELTEAADAVYPYLRTTAHDGPRYHWYYLRLSLASLLAGALIWVDVLPVDPFPVFGLSLGLIALLSLHQTRAHR